MEERKIISISQRLFNEAIMTFPAHVLHADISLIYGRMKRPVRATDKEYAAYIKRCIVHNLIPESHLSFEYDNTNNIFSVQSNLGRFVEGRLDKATLDLIVKGGRFENVGIKIGWDDQGKGIEKLKDGFLEAFTLNGYHLSWADVWVDYDRFGSHETRGDEKNTGLRFNTYNKEFVVTLGDKTDKGIIEKLNIWFDALQKKYKK
jgi:hypothetical protein